MPSAEWIEQEYALLSKARGEEMSLIQEATDLNNWDIVLPLPGKDRHERAGLANLIRQATDAYARRTASVMANILVPPLREGAKRSEDRSRGQQDVHYGWWYKNAYKAKTYRRARWLYCFGSAPVYVRPPTPAEVKDKGAWVPIFEECNPAGVLYPFPSSQTDITPPYAIRAGLRTWKWLTDNHEDAAKRLKPERPSPSDQYKVLTYVDPDELHMVVLGKDTNSSDWGIEGGWGQSSRGGKSQAVTLSRVTNHADICTMVVPVRGTLDRTMGAVDRSIYGQVLKAAKLDALQYAAIFDQVLPEEWLESTDPGVVPRIIQEADPAQGQRGVTSGGRMNRLGVDPTVLVANNPLDRLERELRQNLGLPSEMGGEFATNVRSNVQSAGIVRATMDFGIQEDQETLARSAEEELHRGIKVAKGWNGSKPQTFFVGWPGVRDRVTYTPNKDLYTEDVHVFYGMPGVDIENAGPLLGNAQALGHMSRKTARRLNPIVEDPDFEERTVEYETIEDAFRAALMQPGALPPQIMARIAKLVKEQGLTLFDAVLKAQQEEQERQAAQVQAPPGSPESQPGLTPPGQELVNPQVAGPLDELALLFQDARGVGRGVQA